jgi:Flp pilus assembly protein TadG
MTGASKAAFSRDDQGAVALLVGLTIFVIAAAAGGAVDLFRLNNARGEVQQVADAAALAAASSTAKTQSDLGRVAQRYMDAHLDYSHVDGRVQTSVEYVNQEEVRITVSGDVDPVFMKLAGLDEMPFRVTASTVRGTPQQVEVALVLDNTWSMSAADSKGVKKIDALKTSAKTLVEEIMVRDESNVQVAVVPYADYVNVGTGNRGQSWLSVPADYSVTSTPAPRTCTTHTTKTTCSQSCTRTPKTCTRHVDGVPESYDCSTTQCGAQTCKTETVAPYQTCTGGGSATTTWYRWYGCVGSRKEGSHRLNDTPGKTYPGTLATSQTCLNPILPLTRNKAAVTNTINSLIVNIGGYKPLTYIPAGLTWGINALSPGAPFTEGKTYDPDNRDPRKILVLMTDGENTLRFDPSQSNGRNHIGFSTNGSAAETQYKATNNDTQALCAYAKSQNMEIFTVAFAVTDGPAKAMLNACASGGDHYFDASDSDSLQSAFRAIAKSINTVRLKH